MLQAPILQALKVENSPFSEQQVQALKQSFGQLDSQQSTWLSGYLAGSMAAGQVPSLPLQAPAQNILAQAMTREAVIDNPLSAGSAVVANSVPVAVADVKTLNVLYASQTGNGELVANALTRQAELQGLSVVSQSLNELRPAALKKLEHAVFIMSTHGEGDPPDDAIDLFELLQSGRAPRLDGLSFRVLALGDRSYEKFCECGRQLESLLVACGASVFGDRVECDVEYQSDAERWSAEVLDWGQTHLGNSERAGAPVQPQDLAQLEAQVMHQRTAGLSLVPAPPIWTRSRPFPSIVRRIQKITGLESTRDVHHVELSLEDSGLSYEPGDALGVWAYNDAELVSNILRRLNIDPASRVVLDDQNRSIRETLTRHREITRLTSDIVRQYAVIAENTRLTQQIDQLDEDALHEFVAARQLIDLVEAYPPQSSDSIDAQVLIDLLRPLAPRSYSIASSQSIVDDEVHLTVVTLTSEAIGTERYGVASQMLNHGLQAGDQVGVFVEPNRRFRLPDNPDVPVIMIGAGTGIAPYRAFLQEMEARDYTGDSWLIFGNPNQRTDFLYQREWLKWRETGLLNRIDGAFSRDQAEKYYVQHVVMEQAGRIAEWLDRGAVIYVCGCLAMGHDVEKAIGDALMKTRHASADSGADVASRQTSGELISELRRERRLLKDLY